MNQSDLQARKELLKGMILDLHQGADIEQVKARFREMMGHVSAFEISQMEQQLIAEGLPVEEVRALCDVHVSVFEEGLQTPDQPELTAGHPVHTFRYENFALNELLTLLDEAVAQLPDEQALARIRTFAEQVMQFNRIYLRKENLLFPFLEKHGVSGPTQVMWGIHDQIREQAKAFQGALQAGDVSQIQATYATFAENVRSMFFKEENILYPTALKTLSDAEWLAIQEQSDEIGYCLIRPGDAWQPNVPESERIAAPAQPATTAYGQVALQVGVLTPQQIDLILRHLPVEISFVDENDEVRYYSDSVHGRIFTRTPSVIGRKVQNCHPPKSMHVVQAILDGFRDGTRDDAEFWITMGGRFLHIRYWALRDEKGNYNGALEVTQDVTKIRALEGQKRLLDD
jgi:uncharacterized protein